MTSRSRLAWRRRNVQINAEALRRIEEARFSGRGVAAIFELLFGAAKFVPGTTMSTTIGYQRPEDVIEEGDLFPMITFTLQPANKLTPIVEPTDGPASSDSVSPGATEQ